MSSENTLHDMDKAADLEDEGEFEEAFRLYLSLAEGGDYWSQIYVGWKYMHGEFVEKDLDEALRWYETAASTGKRYARLFVAHAHWELGNEERAFGEFLNLANEEYLPGIYQVGQMYLRGVGVERDWAMGNYYRDLAAKHGHIWAQRSEALDMCRGRFGFAKRPVGALRIVKFVWHATRMYCKDRYNTRNIR